MLKRNSIANIMACKKLSTDMFNYREVSNNLRKASCKNLNHLPYRRVKGITILRIEQSVLNLKYFLQIYSYLA